MFRLLLILLLLNFKAPAQTANLSVERAQLKALLEERKVRFDRYMNSLQEKSGLFGGKSKKDLIRSQEILVEIVRLDNKMISLLNRQLDYKSFEKTTMTYQSLEEQEKLDRLQTEIGASRREIVRLQQRESELLSGLRIRTSVMSLLLLAALSAFLIQFYAHRRKDREFTSDGTGF